MTDPHRGRRSPTALWMTGQRWFLLRYRLSVWRDLVLYWCWLGTPGQYRRRERVLPWPLLKSTGDTFDYALGLRTGLVLTYTDATLSSNGEWLHLNEVQCSYPITVVGQRVRANGPAPMTFDRGLDVRVADIVWAADAPWGS